MAKYELSLTVENANLDVTPEGPVTLSVLELIGPRGETGPTGPTGPAGTTEFANLEDVDTSNASLGNLLRADGDGTFSFVTVSGVSDDLDDVTSRGGTTTNNISVGALTATSLNTHTIPTGTGTLAKTSDIPTNNNQLTNGAGYVTEAQAQAAISVVDAGGDGSLTYSSGTITYTGPSAAEVRAHLSAGGDLSYNSTTGQISFTERTDGEVRQLLSVTGDLAYDNTTGIFSFTERTDSEVRGLVSATDAGGDGSFSYNNSTGVFTYTGPSAAEVRAHLSAGGDLSYNSLTGQISFTERTDAEVRQLFSVTGDLSYNNTTGVFSFTERTDAEVRGLFSVAGDLSYNSTTGQFSFTERTDAEVRGLVSATGDLSYNSITGVFSFTERTDAEVQGLITGGTGVTVTNGVVAIGQAVNTNSNVTFNDVTVSGDLTVSGTTTTINTETINLADNQITLNSNYSGSTPTENAGIEVNRGGGTAPNKTLVWDETADKWTVGSETFVAGTVEADVTGNADTASALATSRTISLGGDVSGSTTFDGSANVTITATVADDSHNHVINNVDGLQTALDGKLASVDLGYTTAASTGTVTNDAGTDATLPAATTTTAGLLTSSDKSKLDGIETGADVTDATNVAAAGAVMESDTSTVNMSFVIDEDTMVSNSATKVPTQQSVKAYVDANAAAGALIDVVDDTTPQLGGNLDVNGNSIVSVSGGDIAITPDGNGQIVLDGLNWPISDGTDRQVLVTDGSGELTFDDIPPVQVDATNNTGSTIAAGTPVYQTGVSGQNITVAPADASSASTMPAIGVTKGSISASGGTGVVVVSGFLKGINTSTFTAGDTLYVANGGGFTTSPPAGQTVLIENLGKVVKSDASAGSIIVTGAGRANATPNLNDGNFFLGNSSNQAGIADFTTSVRGEISATDAGGDGSFSYNSATGAFTYTGPSATETRAHFTGGTGVTITNGEVAIGQDVATTATPDFAGATLSSALNINHTSTTDASLKIVSTETSSAASPVIELCKDSTSPADGDYLGQIKFTGENDVGQRVIYSKITGKTSDVTDTTEDGLLEFMVQADGSNQIAARLTPDALKLINGTGLEVAGDATISGDLTINGALTTVDTTNLAVKDSLIELSSGLTTGALNDAGLVIERGTSGDNAFIGWDESEDKFTLGTTTATGISTGNLTVTTGTLVADIEGDVTGTVSSLSNHDTGNLAEGTNLYYTDARADARVNLQTGANLDLSSKTTSDLTEGTNLYYTNARADARVNLQTGTNLDLSNKNTDDLSQGSTNLYYADSLVDTHLNKVNPTDGYVLSWTSGDYAWVAQSAGSVTFAGLDEVDTADVDLHDVALQAKTTYVVTANGTSTAYRFDINGTTDNPTIYVEAGETIAFDLTGLGGSHPFQIEDNAATAYNTGLVHIAPNGTKTTGSNAQGKTSGTLYWKVPASISGSYEYQCTTHGGMNGTISVAAPGVSVQAEEYPTVTNGSPSVTMSQAFTLAQIEVYLNGVKLRPTTEYSVSGTTLTFTQNLTTGDLVTVVSLTPATSLTGNITVQDEGVSLTTDATTFNFTGAGVTASGTGTTKTINILDVAGISNGELLKYDNATSKYVPTSMVENSSGNVGIGTSTPNSKLEIVAGDAKINSVIVGRGSGGLFTNTVVGATALNANTTGTYNVALGTYCLRYNQTSSNNTAVGALALQNKTSGNGNVAVGIQAMLGSTSGQRNTAVGGFSLNNGSMTGSNNTVVGSESGQNITTGSANTIIGRDSEVFSGGSNYEVVIGHGLTGKGTNYAFIGGTNGIYNQANDGSFLTTSDKRIKKNIADNNDGLDLLSQIQVRNFEYRTPEEITDLPENSGVNKEGLQLGVIAQELQTVLPECVTETSSGVLSVNTNPLLWYLINAVKELKTKNDALQADHDALEARVTALEAL